MYPARSSRPSVRTGWGPVLWLCPRITRGKSDSRGALRWDGAWGTWVGEPCGKQWQLGSSRRLTRQASS